MSGQPLDNTRTATISVLVDNEAGILARVIGLFTGRGYNIDSLTVAPVEADGALSASMSSPPAPPW
jgi:acetolactate synthase-1/3 small subunit